MLLQEIGDAVADGRSFHESPIWSFVASGPSLQATKLKGAPARRREAPQCGESACRRRPPADSRRPAAVARQSMERGEHLRIREVGVAAARIGQDEYFRAADPLALQAEGDGVPALGKQGAEHRDADE